MRILLIEPDEKEGSLIKQKLGLSCFSVDWTRSGHEGLNLSRKNNYDLVLCEFTLPDSSGRSVSIELRTRRKHTPIIIISGNTNATAKVDCLNGGADDYITKPFYFEELQARIRAILRRPAPLTPDTLKIDNVELNSLTHNVTRGKENIYLTRKEFQLLEYFMRNSGMVLSRTQIMDHVWDIHADIFSNTIETHILNLRRKIDFPPHSKLIHTIPGRGYKFGVNITLQYQNKLIKNTIQLNGKSLIKLGPQSI